MKYEIIGSFAIAGTVVLIIIILILKKKIKIKEKDSFSVAEYSNEFIQIKPELILEEYLCKKRLAY